MRRSRAALGGAVLLASLIAVVPAAAAGSDGLVDDSWGIGETGGRVFLPGPPLRDLATPGPAGTPDPFLFVWHEGTISAVSGLDGSPTQVCTGSGPSSCVLSSTPGADAVVMSDGTRVLSGDRLGTITSLAAVGTGTRIVELYGGAGPGRAVFAHTVTGVPEQHRLAVVDHGSLVDLGPMGTPAVTATGGIAVASGEGSRLVVRWYRPDGGADTNRGAGGLSTYEFDGQEVGVLAVIVDARGEVAALVDRMPDLENADGWPHDVTMVRFDAAGRFVDRWDGPRTVSPPVVIEVAHHAALVLGTSGSSGLTDVAMLARTDVPPQPPISPWQPLSFGSPFHIDDAAVDQAGRIIAVGGAAPPAARASVTVARWEPLGDPDLSFGTSGSVDVPLANPTTSPFRMALAPDGKIIVGASQPTGVQLVRLLGTVPPAEPELAEWDGLRTATAAMFIPTRQQRVLDTRPSGTALEADVTTAVDLTGAVPDTAVAAAVNVTAVGPDGPGYLVVWPDGEPLPATSTVNFSRAGETVANASVVALGPEHRFLVRSTRRTHLLVDVVGHWTPAFDATGGRFVPLPTPVRLLDTRAGSTPVAGSTTEVPVASRGDLGLDHAGAVVVTVTTTQPEQAGYVTAWPGGTPRPDTSTVNVDGPGEDRANLAIVAVGPDGSIALYTDRTAHLIVDVLGYFTGSADELAVDGLFRPAPPRRVQDSRAFGETGPLPAGSARLARVSPDAGPELAVVYNLTITNTSGPGFVTTYASTEATLGLVPGTSTVNFDGSGQSRASLVITASSPSPSGGQIGLYNGAATSVDHITDRLGSFIRDT